MTELMKQAEESARAVQCDLMILDGGRHRYRHYGFERAGIKYNYNITRDSIRHCCQSLYGDDFGAETFYSFEIMDRQTEDADDIIDRLYALYSRRHVTARSREDFLPCLQSWGGIIYLVYHNENLVGYINASFDERNIFEFELDDIYMLPEIIYEFIDNIDCDETGITVGADETEKMGFLDKMCDYYNVGMSHQIKILNYRNVLEFLFKWKSKYRRLEQGECTIVINETGAGYQVTVSDAGAAQEIKVETACTVPDIIVENSSELVYLLTTPLCFREQQNPQGKLKNIPNGWFPLPFFLPEADAF